MQLAMKLLKNADKFSAKHVALIIVFALALAGSIGLGVAMRGHIGAATPRDCATNSINHAEYPAAGQCGAADAKELIADARNNQPTDLQAIYTNFGLATNDYDKFAAEAKQGTVFRDGHIEVDGKTVATGAWTMGRESLSNPARQPLTIAGKTYYQSPTDTSFASGVNSLPVMVWFGEDGAVKTAILNPCGNPVTKYTKVTPTAACKMIKKTQPDAENKPNTYLFTAEATFGANATVSRVVYTFSDDNTTVTKNSLTDAVEHTFKKNGEVTVTVYATVPGGHEIQATVAADCKTAVKYVAPMFVCVNLVPAVINQQERSYRFTVKTNMDKTTTLKSIDFAVDGRTDANITTKDNEGNIYKEYSFNDNNAHAVKATVFFNTTTGIQTATCEASVTPTKTPLCTVPGKENLPANSPECGFCKPGVPFGNEACKQVFQPQVLAATGPGENLLGLVAGAMIAGFAGHKLYLRRKLR